MNSRHCLTLMFSLCLQTAHAAGPHVHGVASLDVAVDGASLTLILISPLDSLVGFEHAPVDAAQRAALQAMENRLHDAGSGFLPAPAAGCTLETLEIDMPFRADSATATHAHGHDQDHHHHAQVHGHAELTAHYVYRCEHPERLDALEVRLFETLPRLERLDVQVAAPRGQSATRLTAASPRLSW